MDLTQHRIVVTGGGGFLGQALVAELTRHGVPGENILVPRRADYDLTGEQNVARMYERMRPSVVFHLAAEVGGIGANRSSPGRFFYANMAMGLHLIEHARRTGIVKFVQLGTVCAYPASPPIPFSEEDLWNGFPEQTNAAYGVAKRSLLVMLQSYRRQYGFNGIYLLPANLYGPGDNFDLATGHVIPALVRKFEEARRRCEKEVVVWGSGKPSREFLYVEDCARGLVLAASRYNGPAPVNLGMGKEITIRDLAAEIQQLVGFRGRVTWDRSQPDGQERRCIDATRAAELFGFRAETKLREGLTRTIEWYREKVSD